MFKNFCKKCSEGGGGVREMKDLSLKHKAPLDLIGALGKEIGEKKEKKRREEKRREEKKRKEKKRKKKEKKR